MLPLQHYSEIRAAIEYNQAISKIPKAIGDAADSFLSFGDKAISALVVVMHQLTDSTIGLSR